MRHRNRRAASSRHARIAGCPYGDVFLSTRRTSIRPAPLDAQGVVADHDDRAGESPRKEHVRSPRERSQRGGHLRKFSDRPRPGPPGRHCGRLPSIPGRPAHRVIPRRERGLDVPATDPPGLAVVGHSATRSDASRTSRTAQGRGLGRLSWWLGQRQLQVAEPHLRRPARVKLESKHTATATVGVVEVDAQLAVEEGPDP